MSKVCEICGKGPRTGHNVSHSVRRTKRRFMPNLAIKKIFDAKTGETQKKKLCMKCLKTISKTA
ncbi:50S ribosomal protein L28 [Patescibacteria group bacterium]|nr:50S ribosomal protein L28 [Patescibacteria group bacterium]MBU1683502.1 50S ribosomal protein L28 [Patescibacteria group bacterium]